MAAPPSREYRPVTDQRDSLRHPYQEFVMVNDLPIQYRHDEMERNAYNAAFYELGFRWHWDSDTYSELLRQCMNPTERVRHYLETWQPHLLKAYDVAFLVDLIQEKKVAHRRRGTVPGAGASGYFNWAEALGSELGA
jgi:hypothetical protein